MPFSPSSSQRQRFASKSTVVTFAATLTAIIVSCGHASDTATYCDDDPENGRQRSSLRQPGCLAGPYLAPTGDLSARMPCQSFNINYYRRPYSPGHLHEHLSYREHSSEFHNQPYSNDAFRGIYQSVERQALNRFQETAESRPTGRSEIVIRDKALEFNDWSEYRRARIKWEASAKIRESLNKSERQSR